MNLHKLYRNPSDLDHHDDVDLVPSLAWEKYRKNPDQLKKREKLWARDAQITYLYAEYLRKPFPLGEPAIAKDAMNAYEYARYILKSRFEMGEKAIATDPLQVHLMGMAL